MKSVHFLASFAIVTLVLAATAFAKDNHSGKFDLEDTVEIGSAQLQPGHYKAEWSGPPNDLKINILQHGKTVLTTDGQLKDLRQPAPYDAVLTKSLSDNAKALDEIEFDNRSEALQFTH